MARAARLALAVMALVSLSACRRESKPHPVARPAQFWEEHRAVVATIDADKAYAYMSGHVKNSHNHPAIYASLARKDLTVTGRRGRAVFAAGPGGEIAPALDAYLRLLQDCGYSVGRDAGSADRRGRVIVALDDILPSRDHALRVFNEAQLRVLERVSPVGPGYGYFSGNRSTDHDSPTIYAYGSNGGTLVVIGRGTEQSFPLANHGAAFAAFRTLLAQRGFARPPTAPAPAPIPGK